MSRAPPASDLATQITDTVVAAIAMLAAVLTLFLSILLWRKKNRTRQARCSIYELEAPPA